MRARQGVTLEFLCYAASALFFWMASLKPASDLDRFLPTQRATGAIRVLSWNLGTGVDAGAQGLRNEDIDHVATVIASLDPELVFLQELTGSHQLQALGDALGAGWQWELRPIDSGRPLGVMAQRGELIELDTPFLEHAQALKYVHDSGLLLFAVGLHADAFSAANRNRSIGLAADFLHRVGKAQRTLLAGDLNLDLGIDKRRDLFTDDEYRDVETYNFLAQHMLDVGLGRGPTAKPDRRIDYIFVGREGFDLVQAGPWQGQRTSAMDHHPLLADLMAKD